MNAAKPSLLTLLLLPLFYSGLSSCSSPTAAEIAKATQKRQQDIIASMPAHLRAKQDLSKQFPSSAATPSTDYDEIFAGQQTTAVSNGAAGAPAVNDISDDELVWTDPDNPDENLGSVEQAFTQPIKDDWQLSYNAAQRLAYSQGKPLLIWFTNSRMSPTCKRLDAEVLSTHEFKNWSEDNVIKLRVDLTPNEKDSKLLDKKVKYAQALRKKFKISGNPNMLVIDLNGQPHGRYRGYSTGEGSYYLGRLKQAAQTINESAFDWFPRMQARGYRRWQGRNGVELFAKLRHYDNGRLTVTEPNGRTTSIMASNLSAKDKQWLQEQKAARGM